MNEIGKRMLQARLKAGMTAKDVARIVRTSGGAITKKELGNTGPFRDPVKLEAFCYAVGQPELIEELSLISISESKEIAVKERYFETYIHQVKVNRRKEKLEKERNKRRRKYDS